MRNNRSRSRWLVIVLMMMTIIQTFPVLADQQAAKRVKMIDRMISKIGNQTYSGKRITPKPVITDNGYRLKLNTNYTLSYKNNINIGLASIIIKGKGRYSGQVTRNFQIKPAKIIFNKTSNPKTPPNPTPSTVRLEENQNSMISIAISGKKFTVVLENNNTAKALVQILPLKLNMSELNGNEKYTYLSTDLREDQQLCPEMIHAGDIMVYGDNCLVLFYKTFSTTYNYVKVGHIGDVKGLVEALGSGNVQVALSQR